MQLNDLPAFLSGCEVVQISSDDDTYMVAFSKVDTENFRVRDVRVVLWRAHVSFIGLKIGNVFPHMVEVQVSVQEDGSKNLILKLGDGQASFIFEDFCCRSAWIEMT